MADERSTAPVTVAVKVENEVPGPVPQLLCSRPGVFAKGWIRVADIVSRREIVVGEDTLTELVIPQWLFESRWPQG